MQDLFKNENIFCNRGGLLAAFHVSQREYMAVMVVAEALNPDQLHRKCMKDSASPGAAVTQAFSAFGHADMPRAAVFRNL